jgi:chromosome segregation protein
MRLKELEIQGFKSFPDKTKIAIGEGITGVVGPNGSGKSNISDSIRWVLGETSSKQLRGTGKMEDVIFGGTQSRGAMGFASVALTIDNSDHGLDMDADEVTIGRRYYRSGESEYSINGQNVRLKDVYELLLDTGIGRDGYAIVGQGRIAEIVGAKSAERREIFEEASGIAKYRYRKNEAERRLESAQTQSNAIVASAQSRAANMIRDANEQAQFLAGQENVTELARQKARAILDQAQTKADHLTQGADQYCTTVMEGLSQQLGKLSQDVQAGLNVLEERQRAAREQMPHLTLNDYPEAQ